MLRVQPLQGRRRGRMLRRVDRLLDVLLLPLLLLLLLRAARDVEVLAAPRANARV